MPAPNWYHPIDLADVKRLRSVSLRARWVFIETFCGELGTKTGLVECRPVLVASESGMTVAEVEAAYAELHNAGLLVWCSSSRTAYHVGAMERHPPNNPKHRTGWERELSHYADAPPKARAVAELAGNCDPLDTVSIPYAEGIAQNKTGTEQEQEQDTGSLTLTSPSAPATKGKRKKPEADPDAKPKRFVKPTFEQVLAEFIAKGMPQRAAEGKAADFVDHYESNGWRVGKTPMKSWEATCSRWFRKWKEDNPVQQPKDFTSRWTVQPGQDPDPWGGCRE